MFEQEEISRYTPWLGIQTSISYVLAEPNPISPVHNVITRCGNSNTCKILSACAVNVSNSAKDSSGFANFTNSTLLN